MQDLLLIIVKTLGQVAIGLIFYGVFIYKDDNHVQNKPQ